MSARFVALTLLLIASPLAAARLPPALAPLPEHDLEGRLLELTNAERAGAELQPVQASSVLAQAARHHAEEMVRLAYLSHVSPTPERRNLEDRIRLVGGTHVAVGENLALVSIRDPGVANRIIDGWMASPGHRANLLQPGWTHVGFGLAETGDGRVYAVQVFAGDPNPMAVVDATWAGDSTLALRFEITANTAGWVAIGSDARTSVPIEVPADGTTLAVLDGVDATQPTHVRLGWTDDLATGLLGQQSGWFDPHTREWTEDWRSDEARAEVLSFAATDPTPAITLELTFERDASNLSVLVDDAPVPTNVTGTNVVARIPGSAGVRLVNVGVDEPDGRIRILHEFEVVVEAQSITLR